jgi:hypothetical protein
MLAIAAHCEFIRTNNASGYGKGCHRTAAIVRMISIFVAREVKPGQRHFPLGPADSQVKIFFEANSPYNSSKQRSAMQEEAVITINGVKLTDTESMTVRVAIDTLANVLAEGLGSKDDDGAPLTDLYMKSLSRIQTLLENPEPRKQ